MIFASICNAQKGTNPFDIQYNSKGEGSRVDKPLEKAQIEENVFDIERSPSAINHKEEPDSKANKKEVDKNVQEEKKDEKGVIEKSSMEPSEDKGLQNPFDVSHIPLRKSKLKEEINTIKKETRSTVSNNSFIFWLILLALAIMAVVINTKKNVIPRMFMSLTNINILKNNKREERSGFSGQYILLYAVFFINAGVFIYLLLKETGNDGQYTFLYSTVGVIAIYMLKHLGLKIIGLIFPVNPEIGVFNFSIQVYNIFLGMMLIPINLIVAFGPTQGANVFLYIGGGLTVLVFAIRSFRGLLIAKKFVFQYTFHIFLYLCSSEILPILLFAKLI